VDSVTDKLVEKGVLKLSERESIVSNISPRERIQGILDIVTKRKKGDVFIVVLNETKNNHVAEEITSMEITTGKIIRYLLLTIGSRSDIVNTPFSINLSTTESTPVTLSLMNVRHFVICWLISLILVIVQMSDKSSTYL
jgi:hypothetical protein